MENKSIEQTRLLGKDGKDFVLNLLQITPEGDKNILESVQEFRKEYLKLPSLKSFPFSTYHELSNECLKIPISQILTPLFNTLKDELLDPSRTGDQESIDTALKRILPYSLLPPIQPIFFTLLKRFNNPSKYYHAIEGSEKMLELCPQEVLVRIWKSEENVFKRMIIEKIKQYSERFEEEKRRLVIGFDRRSESPIPSEVSHKEDVVYEIFESIRNDGILVERIYSFLRSMYVDRHQRNRSGISHFFVDLLFQGKMHRHFDKLEPLIEIAMRNEAVLYNQTTSKIFEIMKRINSILDCNYNNSNNEEEEEEDQKTSLLIDLKMICTVSKNTLIQLLVYYCLVNNPSIGILSNNILRNSQQPILTPTTTTHLNEIFIISSKDPSVKEKRFVFHNPNKRVRLPHHSEDGGENHMMMKDEDEEDEKEVKVKTQQEQPQERQQELMKYNNDFETWYIITTIFSHILFSENIVISDETENIISIFDTLESHDEATILPFFTGLQKLMGALKNSNSSRNNRESIVEEIIKSDILLLHQENLNNDSNNNSKIRRLFGLIYFHISYFLLVDRKILTFTKFWNTKVFSCLFQMFYDDNHEKRENDDYSDIIVNLLHQINVEICRVMRQEFSMDYFLRFESEVIREFVIEFLWKNPILEEEQQHQKKKKEENEDDIMKDEDEEEKQSQTTTEATDSKIGIRRNEYYLELLSHIFLDLMKEYQYRKDMNHELSEFVKNMMLEIERRGNDGNRHCKKIFDVLMERKMDNNNNNNMY